MKPDVLRSIVLTPEQLRADIVTLPPLWLGEDENHAAGSGEAAYRLVWKTRRVGITGEVRRSGLALRAGQGHVSRLEIGLENILAWPGSSRLFVPDLAVRGPSTGESKLDASASLSARWTYVDVGSFFELILAIPAKDPAELEDLDTFLARGRRVASGLRLALFEITHDGPVVTEEVGELFPDGHWNCQAGLQRVDIEANRHIFEPPRLEPIQLIDYGLVKHSMDAWARLDTATSEKFGAAAGWLDRADTSPSFATEFVALWAALELLTESWAPSGIQARMEQRIRAAADVSAADAIPVAAHLCDVRNKAVHAQAAPVADDVQQLRHLVELLLTDLLFGSGEHVPIAFSRTVFHLGRAAHDSH